MVQKNTKDKDTDDAACKKMMNLSYLTKKYKETNYFSVKIDLVQGNCLVWCCRCRQRISSNAKSKS